MSHGLLAFVGRNDEHAELSQGIHAAIAGRGGLWLLAGEPGIGKSRLAEELARATVDRLTVLWGRCWEAGGAPPYWPWIQVLRGLLRGRTNPEALASVERVPYLSQLVPELVRGGAAVAPQTPTMPEQTRFVLFDAVAGVLSDAAAEMPLLIILEDLHAADASSLLMLDFVARQAKSARMLILGTFRDVETHRAEASLLSRIAQEARTITLSRLGHSDVSAYLAAVLGGAQPATLVDSIYTCTEGLPLFVVELARLLVSRRGMTAAIEAGTLTIPGSLKAAIIERLAGVEPVTREVLSLAAVIGREFRTAIIEQLGTYPPPVSNAALAEAMRAAIVIEVAPGQYRFSHILVRELLYQEMAQRCRAEIHLVPFHREGDG